MADEQQGQIRRGFVWGQIYIVLSIVFGIIGLVYGIMGLATDTGPAESAVPTQAAIWIIVFSALQLLAGIGVWCRRKWGLWLAYFLFAVHAVATILWVVLFLVYAPLAEIPAGLTVGKIIAAVIHLLIIGLWWGYFIRRRTWFK